MLIDGGKAGPICMDLRAVPDEKWEVHPLSLLKRFRAECRQRPIRISPAVHFFMGGVRTDEEGQTDLSGLFACGEMVWGLHPPSRRAGRPRRGGLGGMRAAWPRRRADRALPAGPRRRPAGGARRRPGGGRRASRRGAPRGDPGLACSARRLVLSGAVRRRRRRLGPGGARRAVGPGVGGRGHQRHVRPAAGAALEASGGDRRPRPGRLATLGPPEAAGRWSLVDGGEAPLVGAGAPGPGEPGAGQLRRACPEPRSASTRWRWSFSTGTAC